MSGATDTSAGRVVVITGAAGGMGRATARLLAARGVRLVLVDIDETGAEETRAAVPAGIDAIVAVADVTDAEQVAGYVEAALRVYGRIDGFFNNAAYEGAICPLDDYPLDDFQRIVDINIRGVFLGLRAVLPVMRRQGLGSIVNVSSQAGLRGVANLSVYSASKHAVLGLSAAAALEAAADGVCVNTICPGPTATPMLKKLEYLIRAQGGDPESFLKRIPVGRYGQPEEIGTLVTWLLTDAPRFLTGAVIAIDGGMTLP